MRRNIIAGILVLLFVGLGTFVFQQASAQSEKETINYDVFNGERPEAVLLTEDFSYAAGQLTDASGGANVGGGNWVTNTGTGSFIQVTAGSLTYPNSPASGVGNKIQITATTTSAEDTYRSFTTQTAGTTYASFLLNVADTNLLPDNASTTGEYFAGFVNSTTTTAFVSRVTIRQGSAPNTFQLGLRATGNAGNVQTFSSTNLPVGTTVLVVVGYQIVDGATNDVSSLWVNPALGGAEPAPTLTQVSAADSADIGKFFVRQGSGSGFSTPNAAIDGLRVGTVWADVASASGGGATPTPTPSPSPSASPSPSPTVDPSALPKRLFTTRLSGAQEVPAVTTNGRGFGRVVLNAAETEITASFYWEGLSSGTISGHIHGPAAAGVNAPVLFNMNPTTGVTSGSTIDRTFTVTPAQVADLRAGLWYFNIHTTNNTGGEIRGQLRSNTNDAPLDFNGDGKTDFGVVRSTPAVGGTQARWYNLINETNGAENQVDFGVTSDSITPGDFDGDGKDDIAVWRSATDNSFFIILQSSTNTVRYVRFGIPNDDPFLIADYDGDGIDDPAIFRKGATDGAQSQFWWFGSYGITKGVQVVVNWGVGADTAAPGDYNGDGKADFLVNRTVGTRAVMFIHYGTGGFDATSPNDTQTRFGLTSDLIVPGDYDGDGKTDIAVSRAEGAALAWYFLPSAGGAIQRLAWGRSSGDSEVQGDYDGDGKTDYAVWRSSAGNPGVFFILRSSNQTVQYQNWGLFGDAPTAQDSH